MLKGDSPSTLKSDRGSSLPKSQTYVPYGNKP